MPPKRKLVSKAVAMVTDATAKKASKMAAKRSKSDEFSTKNKSDRKTKAPESNKSKPVKGERLGDAFFEMPCEMLARRMLGQTLVRRLDDGRRVTGRIVETESYLGGPDAASCSHNDRQTPANAGVFMKPGTAFVYMTYGMYFCFNISSGGHGSAVLLRALEPLDGLDVMRNNRGAKLKDGGASLKDKDLCAGPSKLCMALDISKNLLNQRDLVTSDAVWMEQGDDDVNDADIVAAPRVGIGARAGVWQAKPLRFYVRASQSVSVRDVKAEAKTAN